jgi:hypothetical protein
MTVLELILIQEFIQAQTRQSMPSETNHGDHRISCQFTLPFGGLRGFRTGNIACMAKSRVQRSMSLR